MDTTQLLKGVLDLAVLAVVNERDGYGYDVLRRLRQGGLDGVGDASVYGTLRRLFNAGLLNTYVVPSDEGPHRKYYALNAGGRAELQLGAAARWQPWCSLHMHNRTTGCCSSIGPTAASPASGSANSTPSR